MRTLFVLASVTALLAFNPTSAYAQPAPPSSAREEARKLADQGFEALKASNYKAAAQFFRQADERFHAVTLVLLQGQAVAKSGSLLEARALYQRVLDEALPPGAPQAFLDAQAEARTSLAELNKRIPTLRIDLQNAPDGARVTIDGVLVPASEWSKPIAREPRAHTIVATAAKREPLIRSVTLEEGAHESVTLTFPAVEPSPAPAAQPAPGPAVSPAPAPVAPAAPPPLTPEPIAPSQHAGAAKSEVGASPVPAAIAFGLGGVGVVTGLITGGMWRSRDSDIRDQCDGNRCPAELQPDIDKAKTLGKVAVGGFIVGGLGLGVGIALIATSGSKSSSEPSATTSLFIGPDSLTVRGSF
jgi:hypothetical protein